MEGGAEESSIIKPINKNVVHKICAGQVILDLSSAVKELVENSLDAGATSIEIALKDHGLESFQVIDNGSGISPQNFKVLALKHHTSKLLDFPDLQLLTTFGFRGEALSSLCALGDLTVETRTMNEVVASHLAFDRTGLLTAESKSARQVGTTITVKKLFSTLPVRSKEFQRNIRKEYGKLITLLNAYALIAKGVRIVCTNTTGKNVRSTVLKTQGSGSLKENIVTLFGSSTFSCLEPVNLNISDGCVVEGYVSKSGNGCGRTIGDRQFFFVNGRPVDMLKIGKLVNELYRGVNSKQYPIAIMNFSVPTRSYDINVTPDKRRIYFSDEGSILRSLREALEKIYSSDQVNYLVNRIDEMKEGKLTSGKYSPHESPQLPSKLLLTDDSAVQKERDDKLCANNGQTTAQDNTRDSWVEKFALGGHGDQNKSFSVSSDKTGKDAILPSKSVRKGTVDTVRQSSTAEMSLDKFFTPNKRKHECTETALSEIPILRNGPPMVRSRENASSKCAASPRSSENCDSDKVNGIKPQPAKVSVFGEAGTAILFPCGDRNQNAGDNEGPDIMFPCVDRKQNGAIENINLEEHRAEARIPNANSEPPASVSVNSQLVPKDLSDGRIALQSSGELDSSGSKTGFSLQFSFQDLISRKQRLSRLKGISRTSERAKFGSGFTAASLELSQTVNEERKAKALAAATSELERLFKKEDFKQMKVIGQFNLGFIIGKLDQDLFVVDQHAADEKHNYERLSQNTILNQQPLLRPLRIELAPEEEVVISMHMETFRKNGFLLEEDIHAPCGRRFILKAVPFSKNITFGVGDVKDLISILSDSHGECAIISSYRSDTADSVCPPRVRAMLASRACKASVMVGDPLGKNEMDKILEHLAVLKSPWNCPHGRPTMRHLVDLRSVRKKTDDKIDEEEAMDLWS